MQKVLKVIGFLVIGLLVVVILAASGMVLFSKFRLNRNYTIQPDPVSIPSDLESIEHGAYIYQTTCKGCHGSDLAGTRFFEDPMLGHIPASNLTSGQGGIGSTYQDIDFVRAIRHGIGSDGNPLLIMPSKAYWYFSDADLGALIAFLKTASPADSQLGTMKLSPLGHILLILGAFGDIISAEEINHTASRQPTPQRTVSVDYGEYLVTTRECRECHGENLSGGKSPEPGAPFAPSLTSGGVIAAYTETSFISTMRTGVTPYNRPLDAKFMPYETLANMTDEDLTAIFQYLNSLSAPSND